MKLVPSEKRQRKLGSRSEILVSPFTRVRCQRSGRFHDPGHYPEICQVCRELACCQIFFLSRSMSNDGFALTTSAVTVKASFIHTVVITLFLTILNRIKDLFFHCVTSYQNPGRHWWARSKEISMAISSKRQLSLGVLLKIIEGFLLSS